MIDQAIQKLRDNIASVFLGHPKTIDQLLIGLFARGHVLIEDVPGVGKTVLAKALAKSIACDFSRIQLTPDLMPGDVLGVSIYNAQTQAFDFKRGPVFANIVLADEINRTTPRTQSALLEAMSEEQVSIENQTFKLDRPFMVVATQNPFEFEGTYYLPENQLDRFLIRVAVGYPPRDAERSILTTQPGRDALDNLRPVLTAADVVMVQDQVPRTRMDPAIVEYLLDLIEATRRHEQLHLGPLAARIAGADGGGAGERGRLRPRLRPARRRQGAVHRRVRPPRDQQELPEQRRQPDGRADPPVDPRHGAHAALSAADRDVFSSGSARACRTDRRRSRPRTRRRSTAGRTSTSASPA